MKHRRRIALFIVLVVLAAAGCETMGGHMAAGTLIGAGLGAAIGAATGNPAAGAAIGAGAGLVGGTITGLAQEDMNRRYALEQQQLAMAPPPPPTGATNSPYFDYNDRFWKCYDNQGRLLIWQYYPAYGWLWR